MKTRLLLSLVFVAIAVPYVLRQARKPNRWLGRVLLWNMNFSHSALTDWGLRHVRIEKASRILDVGCGGGRTIQKMAAIATEGTVCGVDFAQGSVAASRAQNAQGVRAGRIEIQHASVSRLPYPDREFDLVTAVETHYYWPDLAGDLREVLRVLKPGGASAVIAETYRSGRLGALYGPAMKALGGAYLTAEEHRAWFESAGFVGVQVFEERGHGWICVTGRRPADAAPGAASG